MPKLIKMLSTGLCVALIIVGDRLSADESEIVEQVESGPVATEHALEGCIDLNELKDISFSSSNFPTPCTWVGYFLLEKTSSAQASLFEISNVNVPLPKESQSQIELTSLFDSVSGYFVATGPESSEPLDVSMGRLLDIALSLEGTDQRIMAAYSGFVVAEYFFLEGEIDNAVESKLIEKVLEYSEIAEFSTVWHFRCFAVSDIPLASFDQVTESNLFQTCIEAFRGVHDR